MNAPDFAAIAAKAGEVCPQKPNKVDGRVLLIDGDGLAYYCAGKDDTSLAEAVYRTKEKIEAAMLACGASDYKLLLTGSGSDKGGRYAIATVKPYQGQRTNSRRPANWRGLREWLQGHPNAVITYDQEADDLFAQLAYAADDAVVIYTQDKDMRMVTGAWHLDWQTHSMFYLPSGTFEMVVNDKVYGHKWFWLQMLQGDTADNIPGLPRYVDAKGTAKLMGEKTAALVLGGCVNNAEAADVVMDLYRGFYGTLSTDLPGHRHWATMFVEQAVLLWMRAAPIIQDFASACTLAVPWTPAILAAAREAVTTVEAARAINAQAQDQ